MQRLALGHWYYFCHTSSGNKICEGINKTCAAVKEDPPHTHTPIYEVSICPSALNDVSLHNFGGITL